MEGSAPEESSWTFYIEGFRRDNYDDENNSSFSSEFESPSLVSDAASSAVLKKLRNDSSPKTRTMCKQNSFKKQKTKVIVMDYDLEDTASSPVNSPKVSYMNHEFMNHKEKAKMDVSEVERNSFCKSGFIGGERDNNYTDLKKGTCDN